MIRSINPATGEMVWLTEAADAQAVDVAITRARAAFGSWKRLSFDERAQFCKTYAKLLEENRDYLARTISEEMGKPLWESLTEVQAMINKVEISIKAHLERCNERLGAVKTRFSPHGIVAIFGPFNFPGHLPNGHIIPALLAGNVILFKPSEKTPKVGMIIAELLAESGLPEGVFTLLQGAKETAEIILARPEVVGLFFTGSVQAGQAIQKQSPPGRILALEMGGNNPLVVSSVSNIPAAVYAIIQSAFLTSGQRCSCARRLIVTDDSIIGPLVEATKKIKIGAFTDSPEPFMGPVVSKESAEHLLKSYNALSKTEVLLPFEHKEHGFVTCGIVDVTGCKNPDEELFGPILQVTRVKSFHEAIKEANNTAFGLAAGLLSDSQAEYEYFLDSVRAGVINWNMPTTGASSNAPFGGVGCSGNYRPSAYFAADYASYPIASQEAEHVELPKTILPGIEL